MLTSPGDVHCGYVGAFVGGLLGAPLGAPLGARVGLVGAFVGQFGSTTTHVVGAGVADTPLTNSRKNN